MKPGRKLILRVIVLVLLISGGAIVNVAVAWGVTVVYRDRSTFDTYVLRSSARGNGATVESSLSVGPGQIWLTQLLPLSCDFFVGKRCTEAEFRALIPSHSSFLDSPPVQLQAGATVIGFAESTAGWPVMSLTGCKAVQVAPRSQPAFETSWSDCALELPETLQSWDGQFVPFRPLWPGFAINTIFYAAVLWVVFLIPAG